MTRAPDTTVVISTKDRAESLAQTLGCLENCNKGALTIEVIVVDNASSDRTPAVVQAFAGRLPIHYLYEKEAGKARALNLALRSQRLGELVAVLDDDMEPHADWLLGVHAIAGRWPTKSWFTGRSYIIWPSDKVPQWCFRPRLRGWAYSVVDSGMSDQPCPQGRWFSGNHFWFRAKVLDSGITFDETVERETGIDVSQAKFMLDLADRGYHGVSGPDALCGHRVQSGLLRRKVITDRAVRVGRGFARARLIPYRPDVKQARLFYEHPLFSRFYCLSSVLGWNLVRAVTRIASVTATGMDRYCQAIERASTYREYLRLARVYGWRRGKIETLAALGTRSLDV